MSNKGKYYMTTAIAYTSGKPHIGNTYEIVLAQQRAYPLEQLILPSRQCLFQELEISQPLFCGQLLQLQLYGLSGIRQRLVRICMQLVVIQKQLLYLVFLYLQLILQPLLSFA